MDRAIFLPPPPLPSRRFPFTILFSVRVSRDTQRVTSGVHPPSHTQQEWFLFWPWLSLTLWLRLQRLASELAPASLRAPIRLPTGPVLSCRRSPAQLHGPKKMTEVVVASSQQRHRPSAPTGPLSRSAMAARPTAGASPAAGAARQHGSETSPAAAPLSAPGSPPGSPAGPPPSLPSLRTGPTHHSAEAPRRPINRKRAASINTEEANRAKIESLSLNTPGSASARPFDVGNLICLCTPAPKVPRPRNGMSAPLSSYLPAPCTLLCLFCYRLLHLPYPSFVDRCQVE